MAVPMAMVVSPPIFAATAVALDVASLVVPAPDLLAALGNENQIALLAAVILPGAIVVIVAWTIVGRLFQRGGVGGMLLSLGAREPRADDLEERQLQNVIEEMAVAAGVPPPGLRLIDGAGLSAAAIGRGAGDATIVVSRGMLDQLDRDETQAIMGHLVASIGNGDLGVAHRIVAMYATVALMQVVAGSGLDPGMRARLKEIWAYATARGKSVDEAERVCLTLLGALDEVGDFDIRPGRRGSDTASEPASRLGRLFDRLPDDAKAILIMPLLLPWALVWMCRMAFLTFLVDPLLTLLWRRRRYLADASATQLTRYPTGLAQALEHLGALEVPLPGHPWTSFLFAAGPSRRIGGKPVASFGGRDMGITLDCLPDRYARMARLRRMGADVPAQRSKWEGRGGALRIAGLVLLGPLAAALYVAVFGLLLVTATLLFAFYPMGLMLVAGVPHVLCRSLIPWLLR